MGESKGTYSNTRGASSYSSSSSSTNSSVRKMKDKLMGSSPMRMSGSTASVAMGLLAGAGVGVLAGILMAPDKGTTTRRRVADSASWVGRGITEALGSNKKRMGSSQQGRNTRGRMDNMTDGSEF